MTADPRGGIGHNIDRYVTFSLNGERYGIEVLRIREIIEYAGMTPVPMYPRFIRGACNLRGHGVPVLDLSLRFGGGETAIGRRTCVVIVEAQPPGVERFQVGLLVDAVNEVVGIAPEAIEEAPTLGGTLHTDYVRGLGKASNGFVVLLDIDRILTLDDNQPTGHTAEPAPAQPDAA